MPESEQAKLVKKHSRGFARLNTDQVPSYQEEAELVVLENMVYDDNDSVVLRNGSITYKTSTQFGAGVYAKEAKDIDFLDGSGAFEFFAYSNGKLAYNTVTSYVDEDTSFTEVLSITGGSPALNTVSTDQVSMSVLNRRLFITDSTANLYYINSGKTIGLVPDPVGYSFNLTVGSSVAAAFDAVYRDDDDSSITYTVTEEKVTTVGTTLKIRQLTGSRRPVTTGASALTKVSGTGDSAIAFTAITYTENFIFTSIHNGDRLVVVSDSGRKYISKVNDGTDLTTEGQTLVVNYGLSRSLTVTNMTPFKRATLVSLSNDNLESDAIATLTGFLIPSTSVVDTRDGILNFRMESSSLGFSGRSAQEIGNSGIGLTRTNGFTSFRALESNFEFGITDSNTVSSTIQKIVKKVDWSRSKEIVSAVDLKNQRYMCAVPLTIGNLLNVILVYDYGRSTGVSLNRAAVDKWSVFHYSLGEGAEIKGMFRLRNRVFISSSLGSIHQIDIPNYYLDSGSIYPSRVKTRAFDNGDKSSIKEFNSIYTHLIVEEAPTLKVTPFVDQQRQDLDYLGQVYSARTHSPRPIRVEPWTDDPADIWTGSPFDIWEPNTSTEVTSLISGSISDGQEIQIEVIDSAGGKFWGLAGVTVVYRDFGEVSSEVSQ